MSEQPPKSFAESLSAFGKLVPGFDFMQQWAKSAGAAMPGASQWVAPTLDPQELEKRIQDLRTVQFWLEQNARMLGMTIQALEVQRMTLDTLKGMNVSVDALRESMRARTPPVPPAAPAAEPPPVSPFAGFGAHAAAAQPPAGPAGDPGATPAAGPEAGGIDPMRWWGSLTQQFAQLATHTMQDAMRHGAPAKQATEGAEPAPAGRPAAKGKPGQRAGSSARRTAAAGGSDDPGAGAGTARTRKAR